MIYKNPFATHSDLNQKRRDFYTDAAAGRTAWDINGREYPLRDLNINDVEFVAGIWRVQTKFDSPIQIVRGKEFVLGARINRLEKNLFEFFNAQLVGTNCYGRFIIPSSKFVVAKYVTDDETYWAYGSTLEQARAFLGIRLYDKYMDVIHSMACKKQISRTK